MTEMDKTRLNEICYTIESVLGRIGETPKQIFNFKENLKFQTNSTDQTLKMLEEVSLLVDDPDLVGRYVYFLNRAQERITAFSDGDSLLSELLDNIDQLRECLSTVDLSIGHKYDTTENVFFSISEKINSFIEQHVNFWTDDFVADFSEFEVRHSNMCLSKTYSGYGNVYVDPVVQLAYFNFVSARVLIHQKYFANYTFSFMPINPFMPNPWDDRLYEIYNISRPHWC